MRKPISILFLFIFFIYGFIGNSNIVYANTQNTEIKSLYINLGKSLEEIKSKYDIKYVGEHEYDKFYSIDLKNPYILGFKVKDSKINLWFYKDRLYSIKMNFDEEKSILGTDNLEKKIFEIYGEAYVDTSERKVYPHNVHYNPRKINDNVLLDVYNNDLRIIDIKVEEQKNKDIEKENFKETVIVFSILIGCIILFTYLIIKLISKFNKPVDKYYILITNMLFSIYLLFLIINKYDDKYILPLFITIFNIYFVTTNIKKVFYYCLYIILNIAFIFDIIKIKIIHGDGIILVMLIILTLNILLGINLLRIWIKNNKR